VYVTVFAFVNYLADKVTRTKMRKPLTEGASYRRVRQLEIHCKVGIREDIMFCQCWFFLPTYWF